MEVKQIPLDKIFIKNNIRKDYELDDMKTSVSDMGVLQPITVKREKGEYFIITGHRRYKAALDAGEKYITCIIDDEIIEMNIPFYQLIENIQRKNLTLDEVIDAFEAIKKASGNGNTQMSNSEIADYIGKSSDWVKKKYKAYKVKEELEKNGVDCSIINDLTENDFLALKLIDKKGERVKVASSLKNKKYHERKKAIDAEREIIPRNRYNSAYGGFFISVKGKSCILSFETEDEKEEVLDILCKIRDISFRKKYHSDIEERSKSFIIDLRNEFNKAIQKTDIPETVKDDLKEDLDLIIKVFIKIHKLEIFNFECKAS